MFRYLLGLCWPLRTEEIDESVTMTFYLDADEDGFGDEENTLLACEAPEGYTVQGEDCNDIDSQISPEAIELCDFQDNNCDGEIDEGEAANGTAWFFDSDSDGYGVEENSLIACGQPEGYSALSGDCNDNNEELAPNRDELCGDGKDNNCDGDTDETTAIDALLWYADTDEDGFGDINSTTPACTEPEGYTNNTEDCDDNNNLINPDAEELCNGIDDDCSGFAEQDPAAPEDATDALLWYADTDEDGFGDPTVSLLSCEQPEGYIDNDEDCVDSNSLISPDAEELCDELDNDCDSNIDEEDAVDKSIWYFDADEDGYGSTPVIACFAPEQHVVDSGDCNDEDATIFPEAEELCDGIDNDCDEEIDLSPDLPLSIFYADLDQDDFGDPNNTIEACALPEAYVTNNEDCDDQNNARYPQATEYCNELDDDCDEVIDNDPAIAPLWYPDLDDDGWGATLSPTMACLAPENHLSVAGDCDDTDDSINPDSIDVCDTLDNDCNGTPDDDLSELGSGSTCPAESCLQLHDLNPALPSGSYWLDVDGAQEIYCEMELAEGGWNLLSVVRSDESTLVIVDDNYCSSIDIDEACKGKMPLSVKSSVEEVLILDLNSEDFLVYTDFSQSGAFNYFTLERGLIYDSSCSSYGHTCGNSSLDPNLSISFTSGYTYNYNGPLIQWWRYGGWWVGANPSSGSQTGRVHASSYSTSHGLMNRSDANGSTSEQAAGHQALFYR